MYMRIIRQVKQSSVFAGHLCAWVRAVCVYQEIARQVQPKVEMVRHAEEQMTVASHEMQRVADELDAYQRDLDAMQVCREPSPMTVPPFTMQVFQNAFQSLYVMTNTSPSVLRWTQVNSSSI
jgi:hypothetical protein